MIQRSLVALVSLFVLYASLQAGTPAEYLAIQGGALAGDRHRVIVSTDIGGTDPDDFQSTVHLLVYADCLDIEGLISSPYGPGRKQHILEVIDCYEKDYGNLKTYSAKYPPPGALRAITKQGETEIAPYAGVRQATEGSKWIVACARRDDPRPLYVLVWGGIEDLAQALHDAPDVLPKLRVYYIGGPNKKWGPHAYQYIVDHHPKLRIIEANSTYRGWFTGGNQDGLWGNKEFVRQHIASHGALGDFFVSKKDEIKMGDTPSVGWLLHGRPEDPSQPGWGGRFVRAWQRPYSVSNRLTTTDDRLEVFGVLELMLPLGDRVPEKPEAQLNVENQSLPGYAPGDGTIRFRFCPKAATAYRFKIQSTVPSLDGKTGGITAHIPSASTAKHPAAELPNWWTDDPSPEVAEGPHSGAKTVSRWREDYLRDFAARMLRCKSPAPKSSNLNKIRFCIFPKSYAYNQNEPELFAFQKKADGSFDFDRPDPAFWHHLEQRILDLQRLGIEADLILWHPYDRWGFKKMSDSQDDRYLRYCIARLSAFRNVWWSLANEYDFMSNIEGRDKGIKTIEDWDRFFRILQDEDPHHRLRGIHNGAIWYDHTKPWVTHASLQTSDMAGGVRFREKYQKPVIYDECKYEGNIPQGWGNLDAKTMTQRFWLGTMSGCYVGHGETYLHPDDILWWSKGGVLHGESPQRIQWLKDLMAAAPPFDELQPMGDDQGRFLLAKPGEYYLLYCTGPSPQTIQLAGERPYKVDLIDPWEMTVAAAGHGTGGRVRRPTGQSRSGLPLHSLRPRREVASASQDLCVGGGRRTALDRDIPQSDGRNSGVGFWRRNDIGHQSRNAHLCPAGPVYGDVASDRFQRRQRRGRGADRRRPELG